MRRRGGLRRAARRIAVAVVIAGVLSPAAARADARCPAPAGAAAALADVDPAARLAWIDGRLSRSVGNARLWAYGWGAGIAAAGVASLAAVPFVAREDRVDWYTGAVSAAVGVAAFVFAPPAVLRDGPAAGAELARVSDGPDVCALLAGAEARLVRDARDEAQQGAWFIHVGNLLFNAGLGLFLGLGYHHWSSGAINAGAGAAVGEAIIFTRPTAAVDAWRAYAAGAP